MSRIARKHQLHDNLFFHVFNRGNAKLEVFHEYTDYEYFKNLIKRYKKKYEFEIFHWVLQPNHFHFSLNMKNQENITKCIGALQQSYTQYHHIKWNSAGKLWQGRFKSQPVEKEKYLYECGRYIERNPMRAGMVKYPWDYKWSSCSVYVKGEDDGITTVDPLFYAFGKSIKNRRENYKAWLMEGEQDLFSDRKNGVGDKDFAGRLIVNKGRFMARRRGRPSKR